MRMVNSNRLDENSSGSDLKTEIHSGTSGEGDPDSNDFKGIEKSEMESTLKNREETLNLQSSSSSSGEGDTDEEYDKIGSLNDSAGNGDFMSGDFFEKMIE